MECLVGDSRGSAWQSGIVMGGTVAALQGSLGMSKHRLSSQCLPCLVLSCMGNHRARAVLPPRHIQKGAAMSMKQKIDAYMISYKRNKQNVKNWKKKRGKAQ